MAKETTYDDDLDWTPTVPDDLLKFLERMFPPKDFKPGTSMDEVMHYSGKRELVMYLVSLNYKRT